MVSTLQPPLPFLEESPPPVEHPTEVLAPAGTFAPKPPDLQGILEAWRTRRPDAHYASLAHLMDAATTVQEHSTETLVAARGIEISALPDRVGQSGALTFLVADLGKLHPTELAFAQLCGLCGPERSPAPSYLQQYPAWFVKHALTLGLAQLKGRSRRERIPEQLKFLLTQYPDRPTILAAVTSADYGRIWNTWLLRQVTALVAQGGWRPAQLTFSDRDCFTFFQSTDRTIRFDGETYLPGFYAWNSEDGTRGCGIATFLANQTLGTRLLSAGHEGVFVNVRHTKHGPERFQSQALEQLQGFVQQQQPTAMERLRTSGERAIAENEEDAVSWLRQQGFTEAHATRALTLAPGDPLFLGPALQGMLRVAALLSHQSDRVTLEQKVAKVLAKWTKRAP